MPDSERILVAVAWPYSSGPRHIGHVAGFGVPSDVFARYHRLKGSDVLMVSGTDDHGTPITYGADPVTSAPNSGGTGRPGISRSRWATYCSPTCSMRRSMVNAGVVV